MTNCERCGQETASTSMSYFNTDAICPDCRKRERAHPKFHDAQRIEHEQVKAGNTNFPGIGLPDDLKAGHHHNQRKD